MLNNSCNNNLYIKLPKTEHLPFINYKSIKQENESFNESCSAFTQGFQKKKKKKYKYDTDPYVLRLLFKKGIIWIQFI